MCKWNHKASFTHSRFLLCVNEIIRHHLHIVDYYMLQFDEFFFSNIVSLIIYVKVIFLVKNAFFLIEIAIFLRKFLKFQVQYVPRIPKMSLDTHKTGKSIDIRPFEVKNPFQNPCFRALTGSVNGIFLVF